MTEKNLWIKEEIDGLIVGLTAFSQEDLGSISFAMLPKVGSEITVGDGVVELEAEKAVVEYEAPTSGTILAVNEEAIKNVKILDEPEVWLYKITK